MEKVEVIWNHNNSHARLPPGVAATLVEKGRVRYADTDTSPDAAAASTLPPGYAVEFARGWYKALDPKGEQIGKSQRSEEAAVDLCVQHANG